MNFSILLERDDVLVVDKPAGVPSVDHARGEPSELVAWLRERFPEVCELGEGPRPAGQVHRLDTATSGVLLVARTTRAYAALRAAFSEPGAVEKDYEALLWGALPRALTLDWEIGMRGRRSPRVKVITAPGKAKGLRGIRPALTRITPIVRSAAVTRARICIETGVRHQIRAHAEAAGYPVVGDPLYGDLEGDGPRDLPEGCEERLYLHARLLRVQGVAGVDDLRVECPAPASFDRAYEVLAKLKPR